MKRFLIVMLICLSLAAMNASAAFVEHKHQSKALNKEVAFQVYVPPDAQPGERFPTLFVLHGAYGGHTDYIERTPLKELAANYRMIIVCPDTGQFSWYVDSPIHKDRQTATYVARELVEYVDATFPTVAKREGRAIMGHSMGGHGALLLTASHPGVFGSASSMSGILKITDHPDRWHIVGTLGEFDQFRKDWEANSVWEQAARLKDSGARIMLDCGVDDVRTSAIYDSRKLHERLAELNAPHIWRELPGTHSWKYWGEHLEAHMNFHQAAMIDATPGLTKWQRHYYERLRDFAGENSRMTAAAPGSGANPSICLLGSSSMEGFPEDLLAGFTVFNRGIIADVLGIGPRGVSRRLELSVFDMNPDVIAINIGTNDLGDRARSEDGKPTLDEMLAEYEEILSRIKARSPASKIIITSSTPVGGRYAHLTDSILEYNRHIKAMAEKEGAAFIDLFTPLADEEHHLKEELTSDGLHFKRPAYELWAARINELLRP